MANFKKSEYLVRLNKVKEKMNSEGIDLMLITDPANMNYVSGYDALSFYTPQVVLVSLNLEQPVWLGRYQDYMCARKTTWLDSENIVVYPDKYLWEPKEKHVMNFVADFLKGKGLADKVIGVEMDAYYFTAFWFERLKKALPDAEFRDETLLVNWIRTIKSEREIDYMKKAAVIVENVMQTAVDSIDVGVREYDAAADIYHAQVSGTEDFGGDYSSLAPIIPSGEKTTAAHLTFTEERYKNDQIVYVEIAGVYKRYHAPLARTIFLGNPSQKIKDTVKVVIEGLNTAMETMKPGVTCEEVEKAWQNVISKHGLEKESRMGYAVGLSYPPVWVENTAYMRPGDKTVLKPNMTFHLMPGMWFEDFGVAVTESVRVTEDGLKTLTNFPRKLFAK